MTINILLKRHKFDINRAAKACTTYSISKIFDKVRLKKSTSLHAGYVWWYSFVKAGRGSNSFCNHRILNIAYPPQQPPLNSRQHHHSTSKAHIITNLNSTLVSTGSTRSPPMTGISPSASPTRNAPLLSSAVHIEEPSH